MSPGSSDPHTYRQIPSGSYVFRVKAFNLDGVSTPEDATFAFTIKPPFWKTFWFIGLAVLAGLGLMYGYYKIQGTPVDQGEKNSGRESEGAYPGD